MGKIVFIGDSITKGTDYGGVTSAECFAHLIGVAAGYTVGNIYNKGVSSENAADGLLRLTNDVINLAPSVCVVMFGNNDAYGAGKIQTPAKYKSDMISYVVRLRDAGIKVVFHSPMMGRGDTTVFQGFNPYLIALEEVVGQYSVPYVDLFREYCFASARSEYLPLYVDNVHQTKAGHQYIANYAIRLKHTGFYLPNSVVEPQPEDLKPMVLAISDFLLDNFHPNLTTIIQAERVVVS